MAGLATGLRRLGTRGGRGGRAGRALLGRRRPPPGLLALGILAGLAAALPAVYLLVVLAGDTSAAIETIFDSRTLGLALRTVGLTVAVTATAIAVGGPGAIFWMWVSGLVGMATKFAEVALGLHFRRRDPGEPMMGGP